jgi:hypothetical protein
MLSLWEDIKNIDQHFYICISVQQNHSIDSKTLTSATTWTLLVENMPCNQITPCKYGCMCKKKKDCYNVSAY